MHFVYDIDIIVGVGHVNYIPSRALNVRGPIERATLICMITRDYYLYLRMCYLDCVFKQLLGNDHQIYSLIGDNGGVPSFRFQKSELAE